MNFYLASRLSNQHILLKYKQILLAKGYEVTSRWLDVDRSGFGKTYKGSEEWKKLSLLRAIEDYEDIKNCDAVICYVNKSNIEEISGGMFIECGLAIAFEKPLYVIEPTYNVFFTLPNVTVFETWEQLLNAL